MLLIPISTALTLARPPWVTYTAAGLCFVVFLAQLSVAPLTELLMYYPHSWNPLKMVTYAIAHGSWLHLIGNLIFFLAFAPALEAMLESKLQYVKILVLLAIASALGYSISMVLGSNPDIPTLGFSGVVSGMIGLSAYMMPKARIRVFWWYIIGGGILHVPAWILAVFFIGMDAWIMLTKSDYGGINVVAHVAGGVAGYAYGYFRLKERKEEVREELEQEMEAMKVRRQYGRDREDAFRSRARLQEVEQKKTEKRDHDRFMRGLYQMVTTHRDSEAVLTFLQRYPAETPVHELETLYKHMIAWGPSRFILCIGRLMIERLDQEKRYGRVLTVIEECQRVNPQFLLADVSRAPYFAAMALETGKPGVALNLMSDADKRYRGLLNTDQCNHLWQKARAQS